MKEAIKRIKKKQSVFATTRKGARKLGKMVSPIGKVSKISRHSGQGYHYYDHLHFLDENGRLNEDHIHIFILGKGGR